MGIRLRQRTNGRASQQVREQDQGLAVSMQRITMVMSLINPDTSVTFVPGD